MHAFSCRASRKTTNKWVVLRIIARQTSFVILTARYGTCGFLPADRRLSTFPLITGQSPSRKYLGFTIASYVAWKQNIIMCNRTLSALQRARWCMHKRNLAARLISVATRAKYLCTMQNFKLWHIRVICNFVLNVVNLQLLHLCPFLSNVDWH